MLFVGGKVSSLAVSSIFSVTLLITPSLARPQVAQPLSDHLHPSEYPVDQCVYPDHFAHIWDDAKVVPSLPDPNVHPELYVDTTFTTGNVGADPNPDPPAPPPPQPPGPPAPIGPYGNEPCAQIRFHRFDDCRGFIRLEPYRLRFPDNRYNVVWEGKNNQPMVLYMWTKPKDRTWWDQERITPTAGSILGQKAIRGAIDVMFDISCPPSGVMGELTLFWTADMRPLDDMPRIEGGVCDLNGGVSCSVS